MTAQHPLDVHRNGYRGSTRHIPSAINTDGYQLPEREVMDK